MNIDQFYVGRNHKSVVCYLHDIIPLKSGPGMDVRPAVVVCPGGGYHDLSKREADPVAMKYFAYGFNVFILSYSIGEELKTELPLREASEAIATIKERAEEFRIFPDQIAIIGFSAGGHVAASLATLWNSELVQDFQGENKPDCAVLCYPVITSDPLYGHQGSFNWLCGEDKAKREFYSLEKHVSDQTVPCFLFHTTPDAGVPVENSLFFAIELSKHKIPFEAHLFQEGKHGISVATREVGTPNPATAAWLDLSLTWLSRRWNFIA